MKSVNAETVQEYVAAQPKAVRPKLEKLRHIIKAAAPKATESISYRIPAYHYHGRLVYFAAFKNHIGLYPLASGVAAFKKELAKYDGAKGSIKFPLDEPLPFELIRRIVRFRVKENSEKLKP
jgi:uncharacterized protein YdhG (YjbR/CyaY superfamily)